MGQNKSMVKSCSDLMNRECSIYYPVFCGIKSLTEFQSNIRPMTTYIFIALSKFSCPLPRISEHLRVKFSTKLFRENISSSQSSPLCSFRDIHHLPLIKLSPGCNMSWNECIDFFSIERSCSRCICEIYYHIFFQLPLRIMSSDLFFIIFSIKSSFGD